MSTQYVETPDLPVDVSTGKRVEPEAPAVTRRSKSYQKRDELVEYLLTGVVNPQWFTGEIPLSEEGLMLISEFSQGTKKDIGFLSEAIKYARHNGQNADIVYAALVIFSASPMKEAKKKFLEIFNDVILLNTLPGHATGDISAFMQIINAKIFRGFGKLIQKALKGWVKATLSSKNALHLYASTRTEETFGSRHVDTFIYRDIIRLSHYKATTPTKKYLVSFLQGNRALSAASAPTQEIKNFITFRRTHDATKKASYLKRHKLNFYLATRNCNIPEIWQNVFKDADIIDMVMLLNDLRKYKVFELQKNVDHFVYTITDKKTIKKYPMLTPFHFMKLYDAYVGNEEEVLGALKQAIDISYCNLPKTDKTIAIVLNNSSNMAAMSIAYSRSLNAKRVINTLGAILYKYVPSSYLIPFAEEAREINVKKSMTTADVADVIDSESLGKSADNRNVFRYLLEERVDVDAIVAITKGPDWREMEWGDELPQYFMDVNPEAKAFFWNLSEYESRNNIPDMQNMVFLDGPDYRVIKFIIDSLTPKLNAREHIEKQLKQS